MNITLVNGLDHSVPFTHDAIKKEASFDNGLTSIIRWRGPKSDIVLSQHEQGEWDIDANEDPVFSFEPEQADDAVKEFMYLIQTGYAN